MVGGEWKEVLLSAPKRSGSSKVIRVVQRPRLCLKNVYVSI
jgi:hypothetical protein